MSVLSDRLVQIVEAATWLPRIIGQFKRHEFNALQEMLLLQVVFPRLKIYPVIFVLMIVGAWPNRFLIGYIILLTVWMYVATGALVKWVLDVHR